MSNLRTIIITADRYMIGRRSASPHEPIFRKGQAVAKGITVNDLAIINEKTGGEFGTNLYTHTHPPGGLPNYYRDNVIGCQGAFVLQVVNFDTFAEAMTNKLLAEVSDSSPHSIHLPAPQRPFENGPIAQMTREA